MRKNYFTIKELAKAANINEKAMYMRYRRGQIKAANCLGHRLIFSYEDCLDFLERYFPFTNEWVQYFM